MSPLDATGLRIALAVAGVHPRDAERYGPPLLRAMRAANIGTGLRQAHFLAHALHESALLSRVAENLNYSAAGLQATWPRRFDAETARQYARQPERIANRVYADRLGNGDEASGDGWAFRGRGLIQITGRANYRECGDWMGVALEDDPRLAEEPEFAARTAAWYWITRGCNALADADDVEAVTRKINGGTHGLAERRRLLDLLRRTLEVPA